MLDSIDKILLVTDLDGTLLPTSKKLSPTDINSINEFVNAGGKFSIATGRAFQSAYYYFDKLKITSPIILYNGSMIYDVNTNQIVWQKCLPITSRKIVSDVLSEFPYVSAEILTFEKLYAIQKNEVEQYHINLTKTNPIECSLDEVPDGWLKFLFALMPEQISEIIEFIDRMNYNEATYVQSCRHFYEVLPKDVSKGIALKILKEKCEYEDYKIVAVGDFNNDIEMLKYADVGIATSNAHPDVKAIADIVLDKSCDENAISEVINYIFSQTLLENHI